MAKIPKYIGNQDTFKKELERVVRLRKELSDRSKEVRALIDQLESNSELPGQVKEHLETLNAEASKLSALLTSTQTFASSIETYYASWSTTKDKIDEEYKEAQEQNETLARYIKDTQDLKAELKREADRSAELLSDARNTLDIVTNTGLSSEFIKRSKDRRKARRWWTFFVALSVLMFALSVLFAVTQVAAIVSGQGELTIWILRLAVVIPFAYILYFVTRQYSHERDLEEKYAFKGLIGQTLMNNTKLLRDEFLTDDAGVETREKILDFTIEAMKSIYKEPYGTTKMESKFKFNPKTAHAEAEVKAREINL